MDRSSPSDPDQPVSTPPPRPPPDTLEGFDPTEFRERAHLVADTLADYLQHAQQRSIPVLRRARAARLLEEWDVPFPAEGRRGAEAGAELRSLIESVLQHSNHLHHPGYVGHQVAVTLPAAALLESVNALLNNGMAVYEMGQLQTVMERRVVEFLAATVGLGDDAGGVLTHGGSLGNLTALLALRQARAEHDVWTDGHREPMSVLVSDQAHYCVARAVQIMGWGAAGAWPVPSDARCRMDPAELPHALAAARSAGRRVVAVVASACTTATGSFDPLAEIAAFCEQQGLWFHVDGAHGASLLLSPRHRHRLHGIERADSVVWDLHKMMGLPALSTALLFREARRCNEAFAQEAGYLYDSTSRDEQCVDLGPRTFECTKRGMGVTAYCMLHTLGTDCFARHIDTLMELTQRLEDRLREAEDFELAAPADANILCFRHRPPGLEGPELDRHQKRLREAVIATGRFYLVQTQLRGARWLRVTLMNPLTRPDDLDELLAALRKHAAELSGRGP